VSLRDNFLDISWNGVAFAMVTLVSHSLVHAALNLPWKVRGEPWLHSLATCHDLYFSPLYSSHYSTFLAIFPIALAPYLCLAPPGHQACFFIPFVHIKLILH
jgi:hypothetical protein